ncbi:hypothetical protein P8452_32115 [Trifolium repens]|nr:hypothetical protein P8452_32115 [Trifolium repens]
MFCHLNVEIEFYFFADFDDRILKQQEEEEERKRQRREKKKEKKKEAVEEPEMDPDVAALMGFGGFRSSNKK